MIYLCQSRITNLEYLAPLQSSFRVLRFTFTNIGVARHYICHCRGQLKNMSSPSAKPGNHAAGPRRNLTGIARHVRDLAADVHGGIQRWNDLHLKGVDIVKTIVLQEANWQSNSESLQELCNQLESICDALNEVVRNLDEIARQMIIVTSLDKSGAKLFDTWPTIKFGQVVESIYRAYRKEAKVKRNILENVAHDATESARMLHLAGWGCQPLLPGNLTILAESLFTETGHR